MRTVTEIAREIGSPAPKSLCGQTDYLVITPDELERFAELVRADEREACAQLCAEDASGRDSGGYYAEIIRDRSNT
jgi:hypothetical protein